MTQKKPKLGVLALMLEDYLPLFPGIDRAQTAYVNEVLDGLRDAAEFVFPHAAMNRAQIESLVAQYNHEKLDGILILLLTYSQGAYLVRALEENHLPDVYKRQMVSLALLTSAASSSVAQELEKSTGWETASHQLWFSKSQ